MHYKEDFRQGFRTEQEYLKHLYFGKRGFEFCEQNLTKIYDYDTAVYDKERHCFFESKTAQAKYYEEKGLKLKFEPSYKKPFHKHNHNRNKRKAVAAA